MWRRSDLPQRHAARDWLGVEPAPECVCLHPANGLARAYELNSYQCMATGQARDALRMPGRPLVLSIGRRCQQEGCASYWAPYEVPYVLLSNGNRI